MKRHKSLAVLFMICFLLGSLIPVYGAEQNSFSLPLSVDWGQGGLIPGKIYQLTMEGTEGGEPMPDGTTDQYAVELKCGKNISALPEIVYETPGEYTYLLELTREDGKKIGNYYLHITAACGENENLEITCSIHKNSVQGIKTDQIRFQDPDSKVISPTVSHIPQTTKIPVVTELPETSGKNEKDSGSERAGQVKTGDETRIFFYLLAGCAALFCILTVEKRKKKS